MLLYDRLLVGSPDGLPFKQAVKVPLCDINVAAKFPLISFFLSGRADGLFGGMLCHTSKFLSSFFTCSSMYFQGWKKSNKLFPRDVVDVCNLPPESNLDSGVEGSFVDVEILTSSSHIEREFVLNFFSF